MQSDWKNQVSLSQNEVLKDKEILSLWPHQEKLINQKEMLIWGQESTRKYPAAREPSWPNVALRDVVLAIEFIRFASKWLKPPKQKIVFRKFLLLFDLVFQFFMETSSLNIINVLVLYLGKIYLLWLTKMLTCRYIDVLCQKEKFN